MQVRAQNNYKKVAKTDAILGVHVSLFSCSMDVTIYPIVSNFGDDMLRPIPAMKNNS